jgi:1-acyl-sn-glycerol-3-phosphate acyltransferase
MENDPPSPLLFRMAHTRLARSLLRAYRIAVNARISGAEHIPGAGGALLVGNHAALGLDAFPFAALCVEASGRMPRFLGERNLWRIPGVGRMLDAVGAVPGTRAKATALLRGGALVCVYPGGIDDSFKRAGQEYTLQWGSRDGFARVALHAGTPIIPFVGEGVDDLLTVVAREPWLGRRLFGSPRYDLPVLRGRWGLPIPRRIALHYHVLPPLAPDGDPHDDRAVAALRQATFDRMESVLSVLRAKRRRNAATYQQARRAAE